MRVLTETMVHAIEEVTVEQGVDPREAVLVSGGGAAGFNIVSVAARLGCRRVVIPDLRRTQRDGRADLTSSPRSPRPSSPPRGGSTPPGSARPARAP